MKNVFKALLFAVVIGSLCGGFTACSDDDDADKTPAALRYEKKHDTAILLVHFRDLHQPLVRCFGRAVHHA